MARDAELDGVAGRPVLIDLRLAGELEARLLERVGADVDILFGAVVPGNTASLTQPEMVRLTLRLPLRAVVASSSATRSSRSAQQSPPRSAAWAETLPSMISPIARMDAHPALTTPPHIQNSYRYASTRPSGRATLLIARTVPRSAEPQLRVQRFADRRLAFGERRVNADSVYDSLCQKRCGGRDHFGARLRGQLPFSMRRMTSG